MSNTPGLETMMRALVLTILIAGLSGPALAQGDPAWTRERNAALQAQEDARREALAYEREARARAQRARTEAVLRGLADGELAGGPAPLAPAPAPWRPSTLTPIPPERPPAPIPLAADQTRMEALMAAALARSNARVRAASPR